MFYNVENLFDCQHDTLKNDYEFLMAIKDTPIAKQESEIVKQIQKLYFQERLIKDGFQVA